MFKSIFKNELNNNIIIQVKSYNDKKGFKGVNVSIEGPNSISENEITLLEAINLHKCLGKYLKKRRKLTIKQKFKTINKTKKRNK